MLKVSFENIPISNRLELQTSEVISPVSLYSRVPCEHVRALASPESEEANINVRFSREIFLNIKSHGNLQRCKPIVPCRTGSPHSDCIFNVFLKTLNSVYLDTF